MKSVGPHGTPLMRILALLAFGLVVAALSSFATYWFMTKTPDEPNILRDTNRMMPGKKATGMGTFACKVDSDCVKVDNGACGCNSGGSAIAINRSYADFWKEKTTQENKGVMCAQVMSQHPSCQASPKCVNNKCQLEK